jgi:5-methylcytosine-specific restriction protein B
MAQGTANRFLRYFPILLDALRSSSDLTMRPAEAAAWIRARIDVPEGDLTRFVVNGKQSIFENDVHWARFYLAKAGLIGGAKRGLWALTPEGFQTHLTPEETWPLYVRVRDAQRPSPATDETELPAPDAATDDAPEGRAYWFAGASWDHGDQTERFIGEGIWENGYEDQFSELVRRIRPGDRIAIKASFVRKHGLPFDVDGKPVSVMRIKATGIVTENLNDGLKVKVAWDPVSEPRDWYFYTYRTTLAEADPESPQGSRLVDFAFRGAPQDYPWWLSQPYWAEKYGPIRGGNSSDTLQSATQSEEIDSINLQQDLFPYTASDIIADGCFLSDDALSTILTQWRSKKNIVLQGQAPARHG